MFTSKTAFLLDALEYYTTNPNRRCTSKLGRCMYNPKTANKKISEGCLIGRHLTTEQQDKGDDIGSIDFIFNEELEDEIHELKTNKEIIKVFVSPEIQKRVKINP